MHTALHLERVLARELRARTVEIGLVSRENYMVFQPMLPEVISGNIGLLDTITPIRRLCPATNLYTRTIERIDLERRTVSAGTGFGGEPLVLPYDREHFEPEEVVFREGDRGDWLYVVLDGEVEISRSIPGGGDTPITRLGRGECFGQIALVSDRPRSATVRSVTALDLLAVDRDAFQALFSNFPPLRGFFEQLINVRTR